MRKFIPMLLLATIMFVGCKSGTTVHTQAAAPTAAAAAPPPPPAPATPEQTLKENVRLGDLGAAFMLILAVVAVKSSNS
jgi:hypothetical protein